jgi:hypothetical protein
MIRKIVYKSVILGYLLVSILIPSAAETQTDRDFYNKIPNFSQIKFNFSSGSSSFGTCEIWPWFCVPNIPCDKVIKCVMAQQRKTIKARLDDLIHAIEENTRQTENQTKIIEQEVLSYTRLLKRVHKESLSLKEASHLSKKIKDSEALGATLDTTRKGK